MQKGGVVYIVTNEGRTVLYTGVTSNLMNRMYEHRTKKYANSFTAKYNCKVLVYYKFYPTIQEAISEEKRIKAGSRMKKIELIESMNKSWIDLFDTLI